MRRVAAPRSVCYPAGVLRRPRPILNDAGFSIVEVLAVTVVVGIAVIGVALMFGKGSAWVAATGDDRVAAGLAQERIEQIRAGGWALATPGLVIEESVRPAGVVDARARAFRRVTCIQHVDPSTGTGLTMPVYDAACTDGPPTSTRRITTIVTPMGGDGSAGSPPLPEASAVTIQAWITDTGA